MNGVHVVIASYGSVDWKLRGQLAAFSVSGQTEAPEWMTVHHVPGIQDLATIRNEAAARVPEAEWLIFLDADDKLHPDYVKHMLSGSADVRQPSTAGVHPDGRVEEPTLIPKRDLLTGNYIVVGAMVRKEAFDAVGGFRSLPIYEDWDLWLRMEEQGYTFESIPEATYLVTVRAESRNNQPLDVQRRWFSAIQTDAVRRRS